jgi:hypothetical protein
MQINAFKRTWLRTAQLSTRSCCTNPVRNSESVCKRGPTSLSGRLCEEGAAMNRDQQCGASPLAVNISDRPGRAG